MTRVLGFSTLGQPGATLDEILQLAAVNNAQAIELRTSDEEIVHVGMPQADAEQIGQELRGAGITVLCLSSYVPLCTPGTATDPVAEDLAEHLRLASDIGALGVRVFMKDEHEDASQADSEELSEGERRAIRRIAAVAHISTDTRVDVLVETHDSHSSSVRVARFMAKLDDQIADHHTKVLWDTAHTWAFGESPQDSLSTLAPWLAHLQIKDVATRQAPTPVPLGAGTYPVEDLATALDGAGWDGPVALEWERRWHPELPSLAEALTAARRWAHPLLESNVKGIP